LLDALLESLDTRVTAGRLVDDRRSIDQLLEDFNRIGRERGNTVAAAAIACSLLATLERWCRELEDAIRAVEPDKLSAPAREALSRLTIPGVPMPS
jgi:hypothetical protein